MISKKNMVFLLNVLIAFLLLFVTICGILSFNTSHAYEIINQYGETIKIWGTGVYAHDSYFKAPIFIGSDFTILVFIVPLFIMTCWKLQKEKSVENDICKFGVLSFVLYYSASLAFGVTYNCMHLLYIVLFGVSFYYTSLLFIKLYKVSIFKDNVYKYTVTNGMKVFLFMTGFSLFVAWLPDIVYSLINGTSLDLIEVYTTEITYVLDMGIISPLIFITFYLIKQKKFIGYVLLRMIFKVCIGIGIMLPIQSVFQIFSGILIPIPALLTKLLIFVVMAFFAAFFEYRIKQEIQYKKQN